MDLEFLIESIRDIGYKGPMLEANKLETAVQGGAKDVEFTTFVSYLAGELHILCSLDENVNSIKGPDDSISFLLELSSFLKEIGCPYESLTQGHMSDRFSSNHDKVLLLEYLITELMAAKMVAFNNPEKTLDLKLQESNTASDLKLLLVALKFPKPPLNVTAPMLFQKVLPKLQETCKLAGDELVGRPLFNGTLPDNQWDELAKIQTEIDTDYKIRREMLLTRLDCTIQSFKWSDRLKGKEDQIVQIYHNKRRELKVDPAINMSDLLAARDDLAIVEKTSNASVRKNTKSSLNNVIIGQVPDRGGRPSEQAPPPPEMPSWQQRSAGPPGGGRGGRGGNRGGFDNFNRGGNNFNQSFDNRGGKSQNFENRGGQSKNFDNRGGQNQNYDNRASNYFDNKTSGNTYDNRGGGNNFESRGGYSDRSYNRGSSNQGGRSYDSFQHNKSNYAEQFVQDNQQNKQYSAGSRDYDSPRGQRRGRSNYNRGNYR